MKRRLTTEEAMEIGRSLPVGFYSSVTGKPLMSRADWERLPRGRRIRDVLLARQPLKGLDEPTSQRNR